MSALALWLLLGPQIFPGPGTPASGGGGGGGGTVAIAYNAAFASCTPGTNSCTVSATIHSSGNTVAVLIATCFDPSCATTSTVTLSDGTNTYTQIANSTQILAAWTEAWFVAKNVTAGSYTLTFSSALSTFSYALGEVVELSGASLTTPVDPTAYGTVHTTGSTFSLTSAGNVAEANEVMLAAFTVSGSTVTYDSPYTVLDSPASDLSVGYLAGPSSGSTTTVAGYFGSSAAYWGTLIGIQP